jgi:hypothetical protein
VGRVLAAVHCDLAPRTSWRAAAILSGAGSRRTLSTIIGGAQRHSSRSDKGRMSELPLTHGIRYCSAGVLRCCSAAETSRDEQT